MVSLVQAKIDIAACDYCTAYEALNALGAILFKYEWHNKLQPLLNKDLWDLSGGEDKKSDGEQIVSWIWRIKEIQNLENDSNLDDHKFQHILNPDFL